MKMKYWLLTFTLTLTVVFAGCAGSSSSAPSSPSTPPTTLSSITVSSSAPSVAAGFTAQFTATGHYSDGSMKTLSSATWSSSDPTVASISSSGFLTALKAGSTTITAVSGSVNGTSGFSVTAAILQSISVSSSPSPNVPAGFTVQFSATGHYSDGSMQALSSGVTWSSSNAAIATVDAVSGLATGVKVGSASIIATSSSISGNQLLTVTSAVLQSIAVSPSGVSLAAGFTQLFTATGNFSDKSSMPLLSGVTWMSSNPAVASVDPASGLATGLKAGMATISATMSSISGNQLFTVTAAELQSIAVTPGSLTVKVGATQQYSAMGTYSDGSKVDLTSSVTWGSSNSAVATITSGGLASTLNSAASTTISATSGAVSGDAGLTVIALTSLKLSPIGPGIDAGDMEHFTATGTYSDGSNSDITSSATWSESSSGAVATINSSGVATGVAKGFTQVSASAFSISDSTALTVSPSGTATPPFSGSYVFNLTGSASNIPQFYAGILTSDGAGNISGVLDVNTGRGVSKNEPLSGTYSMFPDGRGDMTLISATLGTRSFRFVLYAGATKGRIVQFDSGSVLFGGFEQQSAGPFSNGSVNSVYAFRLGGMNSSTAPISRVGVFTGNGSGAISSLESDVNNNGTLSFGSGMTGSYSISANGRGSLTLQGTDIENFTVYMVSNSKMYMVQIDTGTVNELSGIAESQVGSSFGNSTLASSYTLAIQDTPIGGRDLFAKMGEIGFDGAGNVACNSLSPCPQDEKLPTNRTNEIIGGTYSIDSTGRGTLEEVTSTGNEDYIFYVVSPSKVYLLDTVSSAAIGDVAAQSSGSFTAASVSGTYAFAEAQVGHSNDSGIARIAADGVSSVSGAADIDVSSVPKAIAFGGSYIVSPKGQTTINLNSTVGSNSYIMYLMSSSNSIGLGVSPDPLGLLDLQ